MAKTVDNFATIEDFRKQYNELAYDVGEVTGLNDALKLGSNDTIVDAINVLDNKQFFLQEFNYVATLNQTTFTGPDSLANSLIYKKDHIQVFKNERHLIEDVDYVVASPDGSGSHQAVILQGTYASGQANAMAANDRLTIYSYTGAFIGTEIAGSASTFFQKSILNTIYNTNANGVILNGDIVSATTELEDSDDYTLQLAGKTFAEDSIVATAVGAKFQAPTLSDGTASLSSGSLSGVVNITASGTIQAEQLTTTDDLQVGDDLTVVGLATIGETLGVTGTTTLTGALIANGNVDLGNAISDTITFGGTVDSNITPNITNTQQVGISSRKFSAMHATTFNGNLTGDVTGDVKHAGNIVLDASSGALTGTVSSIAGHDIDDLDNVTIGGITLAAGHHLTWSGSAWTNSVAGSTDTITEGGTNLWYTDARVSTRVGTILQHGNHTNITASTVGAEVRLTAAAQYGDSDVQSYLSEGPGIDLSNAGKISAEVENGIKLGTGNSDKIQLDYSVITDGDLSGGLPSGSGKEVGHLYFLI